MHAFRASATEHAPVDVHAEGDKLVIAVRGDWSLERPQPRFDAVVSDDTRTLAGVRSVVVDARELGSWDSSLLIFLMQCQDFCDARTIELDDSALPDQVHRLLALARAVPERTQPNAPRAGPFLTRLGYAALATWRDILAAVTFTGEVAVALAGLVTGRTRLQWRDFWVTAQDNGAGALPIVTLIALLMGVIVAFLGVVVLERFGAGYYVSYLVGFGMLRELAALMTGIIIAGRTGAAFAAELGSMKITEEVDALTTLGIDPVEHLVLPRLLGLFIMMPLLTFYADFVGVLGGLTVSVAMLNLSLKQFLNGLLAAVTLTDASLGVFKGVIFGFIVGISGTMKGLQGGDDAGAVGRSATAAVVLGITLIIGANALVDWLAALLDI